MGINYQSLSYINDNIEMSLKSLKNFNCFLESNQVVILGGGNTHFWCKMGGGATNFVTNLVQYLGFITEMIINI